MAIKLPPVRLCGEGDKESTGLKKQSSGSLQSWHKRRNNLFCFRYRCTASEAKWSRYTLHFLLFKCFISLLSLFLIRWRHIASYLNGTEFPKAAFLWQYKSHVTTICVWHAYISPLDLFLCEQRVWIHCICNHSLTTPVMSLPRKVMSYVPKASNELLRPWQPSVILFLCNIVYRVSIILKLV